MAVIIAVLVIISICVSRNTSQPTIMSSQKSDDLRISEPLHGKTSSVSLPSPLGIYNMSVRKNSTGYAGVVRASTWNGCTLYNSHPAFSYPYIIELDNDRQTKTLTKVDIDYTPWHHCSKNGHKHPAGLEDPRVFTYLGEDWIIASSLGSSNQPHPCVNAMCIFKVSDPQNTLRILRPPPDVSDKQTQKNWSPFEYKGKLLCEYSLRPHKLLEIDIEKGTTDYAYTSDESEFDIRLGHALRGGAPPVLIGDYYLGVGHTRTRGTANYYHFFYTFEAVAPFNITGVSKIFKFDKADVIQFAAGLSYLDGIVYVSYGVNDCYNRISQFPIEDVIKFIYEDDDNNDNAGNDDNDGNDGDKSNHSKMVFSA